MILINLLPHREEKRKRRKAQFFTAVGASFVLGLLITAVGYLLLQQLTAAQASRNQFLQNEINQLDAQIKDIANLREEIESLRARQRAVEDLQTDRNTPVHLLSELARFTPDGVYLSSIKQSGRSVTVAGVAATNERVSEFLRNVSRSDWLEKPDLVEIRLANVATNSRDLRRLFDFSLRLTIKTPSSEAGEAADAPARPASGIRKS
ncbi:PilN domain-containing protein [Pelomonas sp. CA6]|uniref:PilN domain-containing protein n=1 Tax=Pelomonas sp. CA6 TaxID=2907999 RepID=UPI001F4C105C|nr:PilN domain-containing protein [Pelomonas sp. CA6]MCH7343287.1 PilN domain-containing protein [Pelomonas sp. CA6]